MLLASLTCSLGARATTNNQIAAVAPEAPDLTDLSNALAKGDISYLQWVLQNSNDARRRTVARLELFQFRMRLRDAVENGKHCYENPANRRKRLMVSYVLAASAALADQEVARWARHNVVGQSYALPICVFLLQEAETAGRA